MPIMSFLMTSFARVYDGIYDVITEQMADFPQYGCDVNKMTSLT